ncbi:MAG: radical SAM protein [Desulfobulbus sp.]
MERQQSFSVDRSQINYLILALTTRCNLHCRYCYHGTPERRLDMAPSTLERAFALAANGIGPLHIQLTGGEPCLVPDLIEMACKQAQQLQRSFTLGIQVNGTCLNQRLIKLIRRFGLQVGISLDGAPRVQESLRGRASETLRGLMLLEQEQIPFRVTTVVSNENVGQLDRLAWLLAAFRQAGGIGLDLLVTKGNGANAANGPHPAKPEEMVRGIQGLIKALEDINRQREMPLRLREWDLVRRMLKQRGEQKARLFCQAAQGASLAVHPDGRCFPCGQSLGDTRFAASLDESPPVLPPVTLRDFQADCAGCPLENRCPGDCPSRLFYNPPSARPLACSLYQTLALACVAEQGRTANLLPFDGFSNDRRQPCRL